MPPVGKMRLGRSTAIPEENAAGRGATPFANDGECMGRSAPHTLTLLRVGAGFSRVPRFPRSRPPSRPFAPIHAHGKNVGTGQNNSRRVDPLQWGRNGTKRDFWAAILGLSRGRDSGEVEKNFKKKFCTPIVAGGRPEGGVRPIARSVSDATPSRTAERVGGSGGRRLLSLPNPRTCRTRDGRLKRLWGMVCTEQGGGGQPDRASPGCGPRLSPKKSWANHRAGRRFDQA